MFRLLLGMLFCFMVLMCQAVTAEAIKSKSVKYTQVEMGLATAWMGYNESGTTQYGVLEGMDLRAKLAVPAKHFWNLYPTLVLEADQFGGLLTHDGKSVEYDEDAGGVEPVHSSSVSLMGNMRALMGIDILRGRTRVMPYYGLGLRYWYDNVQDSQGATRWTRLVYLPIGVEVGVRAGRQDEFGFRGEVAPVLGGTVSTYFDGIDVDYGNAHNDKGLGSGFGLRGSFYYKLDILDERSLRIETFFRYWHNNKSQVTTIYNDNPSTQAQEDQYDYRVPENSTAMYGLRLGICF